MILIGLGGNLASPRFGAPLDTLAAALVALEAEGIQIATRSAWYRTEPVPRSNQPWFVNAVASLTTHLAPRDLLAVLQAVERQFGRVRSERNAARVLASEAADNAIGEFVGVVPLAREVEPRLQALVERRQLIADIAESLGFHVMGMLSGAPLRRL